MFVCVCVTVNCQWMLSGGDW